MRKFAVLVCISLMLGCAQPDVVRVRQVGDDDLTCEQIKKQFLDAQEFEEKARKEKGATGTNVAAVVFFWPALLMTYANVEEAVEAAQDRQKRLQQMAADKGCKI